MFRFGEVFKAETRFLKNACPGSCLSFFQKKRIGEALCSGLKGDGRA